jgi:hypothetical protein
LAASVVVVLAAAVREVVGSENKLETR